MMRFTRTEQAALQDEDQELAELVKQRAFKAFLNKVTIDNFEKLSSQILDVGITDRKTLENLIDQIFDKALIETRFCEIYAQLCTKLAHAKDSSERPILPTYDNPENPSKRVDFRRLLLNKCQDEFISGLLADKLVKEREEKGCQGEEEPADAGGATKPVAEQERSARRRMLGNMQFIGQLYKYNLLTERIMHNCVQQLLVDEAAPRAEDVECLCKLLNTVGGKLDSTPKSEFKDRMRVYFERMMRLTENTSLESRIRFMVQDVLDLRDRKWQPRQKVEGPKKISEVHQDAMRQQQQQEQRDREERRGGGGGMQRNNAPPSRGGGGGGGYKSRMLSRDEVPTRTVTMQRQQSSELNLRPPGISVGSFKKPAAAAAAAAAPSSVAAAQARPAAAAAAAVQHPLPALVAEVEDLVEQLSEDKQIKGKGRENWKTRGPPPPPTPGGRHGVSSLHTAANRYVAGQTQSADPDEEKKQRSFKGFLNKLTIDNFEKLSSQILDVDMTDRKTLENLIDQIFDMALIQTRFCEIYAQLCTKLANAKDSSERPILPTYDNPENPSKRVDFRRLLLNKCQDEFTSGLLADKLVKEREEKGCQGEEEPADAGGASETVAEQERSAQRRMLGNMQFIGQLYKYNLLTERIMHNCVQQLLVDETAPRAEDVECLCKLLNTVGGKLDSTPKSEFKDRMRVYFERMKRLTENTSLESRIRFMVQDVLDLRDRKWQPRQQKGSQKWY